MKKNDDENNKKYVKEALAKSKTLTKSANIFMQQNHLNADNGNNPTKSKHIRKNSNEINRKSLKAKNQINEESDEDMDEDDQNNVDEDDEGIFTLEYVTKHIDRYQKKVSKFDQQVKKYLLLSKKHPNKKDEYKDEAIRALKKKKFYSKALERYEQRKYKLEMKSLDREYKQQKKEYKKLTRELKRKVRLVTMGQDYDENDGDDGSGSSDEDNEAMFAQIDLDENTLNQNYEQIISMPEIKKASENLNLFKFIFQEE